MGSDATGQQGAQQSASGRNNEDRVLATLGASPSGNRYLSQHQQTAMEMLLRGCSDAEVGTKLAVDRGTVYRWRTAHPAFRRELERLRQVIWAQQADRMRAMVRPALDVLEKQLENPTTALRAATVLLRFAAPRADALAEPVAPPRDPRERQHPSEQRAFNRALDAFINAPMPDGTRGAEVHLLDDDEEEDDDDEPDDGDNP